MKVSITLTFEGKEQNDAAAKLLAYLKGIKIEHSSGDNDGRRWVSVIGKTNADKLIPLIELLHSN